MTSEGREYNIMGWERRERGSKYYTRSKKIGGRVAREYVGCGPEAERAATEDAERRAAREEARARQQELDLLESHVQALCTMADIQVKAHFLTHGYHLHHRSEWRKIRRGKDDGTD